MRFKIRFADQIVGFFVIVSLASLVLVIVLLGMNQRWFARDITYHTILPTANGLSRNMAVQYKGFTIGNVKSFQLTDRDYVEVIFIIHEEYADRVRLGSLIEMNVSPIGLGSSFIFHSGRGNVLSEGSFIPVVGSARATELANLGFTSDTQNDDSIGMILGNVTTILDSVSSVMDEVNQLLVNVNTALGDGTDDTEIGMMMGSLRRTLAGAETLPQTVEGLIADLEPTLAAVNEIMSGLNEILALIGEPGGILSMVFDSEEDIYIHLVSSLGSVASMLDTLDKTVAREMPQIHVLLTEIRAAISTADDVLTALTNNPLLRRGVPERVESQSSASSPRGVRF